MKIISKFKDYYDFVVFETDNRKIFLRDAKELSLLFFSDDEEKYFDKLINLIRYMSFNLTTRPNKGYFIGCVCLCNDVFHYVYDKTKNKYYYNFHDIPIDTIKKVNKLLVDTYTTNVVSLDAIFCASEYYPNKFMHEIYKRDISESQINSINSTYNVPIAFSIYKKYDLRFVINGRLEDIRFSQVKKPQEAYTDIYNFIKFDEPIINEPVNDINRFESKGFDKKSSFRNIK